MAATMVFLKVKSTGARELIHQLNQRGVFLGENSEDRNIKQCILSATFLILRFGEANHEKCLS